MHARHALNGPMRTVATIALALAAAAGGCANRREVAPPMGRPDSVTHASYPNVVVEPGLNRFVRVDYQDISVREGSATTPMQVVTPIRSVAKRQMAIQYRYLWFDADTRQIGETGWRFAALEPGTQIMAQANSVSGEADSWRLEVRSAR